MRNHKVLTILTALVVGLAGSTVPVPATAASAPVADCAELVRSYPIPGASTQVTKAEPVDAANGQPAYCKVEGVIEPQIKFELRLPISTYNGRYVQFGCGGMCGSIFVWPFPACGVPNSGDVAVAATDDGHTSTEPDGLWAKNNQAARDDWFFRAPHVLSLASKRIIATYYGAPPKTSYFSSCSNGGREGLLLAQRYPHDFDGILAAAPAAYASPLFGMYQPWLVRTGAKPDGSPVIPTPKLTVLHNAVVAACDRLDGLVDGQIEDPRDCRYDPIRLQCPNGSDQPTCLTTAQVTAARKLYAGPTDKHGRLLYPGGRTRGSELVWNDWLPAAQSLGDGYLRYVGYPIGSRHSSIAGHEFTVRELHRLTPEGRKLNAMSLNLDAFHRAGGKLLLWHGWDDEAIPGTGTVDYYQRLARRYGGLARTQEWARLFMVPTMYHCFGGYRLGELDAFKELFAWVEHGTAPDRVIAVQRDAQWNVIRSRPVFPYPLRARYDGTGSIDDAANFHPAPPRHRPNDIITWPGTYLHHLPGPRTP